MLTEKQKKLSKKDYGKAYYEKNKEKIAKYGRDYNEKNKEKIAKYGRDYRERNKEKIAKYGRDYRERNKEKIAKRMRDYNGRKRQHQIQHPDEYLNVLGTKIYTNGATKEIKKLLPILINKKIKEMVKNV